MNGDHAGLTGDSADNLWFKDAVIYEVHVRSFFDRNNDGIGDFTGLTEKLDYLQKLGVTAVWLLPFYPSPLKDDGYDISDYREIHSQFGDLRTFRAFIREAHLRGIRVITELVVNHTSDQHAWFQRSRTAEPGSTARDMYVWSDTPDRYAEARIIFKDFETSNWTWDPVARAYYWHRFYSHQPDLNYDNPVVRKAILQVVDFWFRLGVDGLRLDAVPYLFEREGTSCENLPETLSFLDELRAHVDQKFRGKMLLAEANQWPEDAVRYFGAGQRCHMAFHFPLMPRIFMAIEMEDRFPLIDIMEQTPCIPDTCQWALFLRNHDELTLEMVTDEERDYMYRMYAADRQARINLGIRRRLAPLLRNNRRKIELMNYLLFSLQGTPVIYYGDEIGMGDNFYLGDRNGVRTPMQWSSDKNGGFSQANPQELYLPLIIEPEYHFETINVENQERNPTSLLWWMRRVIRMRKKHKAFGRGDLVFVPSDNPRVLSFLRTCESETILAVFNLSRYAQAARLKLAGLEGRVPVELFSRNAFPAIGREETPFTLGPYDYFWFEIGDNSPSRTAAAAASTPNVVVNGDWTMLFENIYRDILREECLQPYLNRNPRLLRNRMNISRIEILDQIPLSDHGSVSRLFILHVVFSEGLSEYLLFPVSFREWSGPQDASEIPADAVIAEVLEDLDQSHHLRKGVLFYGPADPSFRDDLWETMRRRSDIRGENGRLTVRMNRTLRDEIRSLTQGPASEILKGEHGSICLIYGGQYFLKLYRGLYDGSNPESENLIHLSEQTRFGNVPEFLGQLEYHPDRKGARDAMTIGILTRLQIRQKNMSELIADEIALYLERIASRPDRDAVTAVHPPLFSETPADPSAQPQDHFSGFFLSTLMLMGQRVCQLHTAFASTESGNSAFAPEPYQLPYQRSVYQSYRNVVRRVIRKLSGQFPNDEIPSESLLLKRADCLLHRRINTLKIRIHGSLYLDNILFTGKDFAFTDFEGDERIPYTERTIKRSPLRDCAALTCSIFITSNRVFREQNLGLESFWPADWAVRAVRSFLDSYRKEMLESDRPLFDAEAVRVLLPVFVHERLLAEIEEMLNRKTDPEDIRELLTILNLTMRLDEVPAPPAAAPGN